MTNPQAWHGKRLQLHGYVVDKSIFVKPDTLDYRFEIQNNGQGRAGELHRRRARHVQGRLRGRAQGQLDPDGFAVEPNGVMAKCPSKYERQGQRPARPAVRTCLWPSLGTFLLLAAFVVCSVRDRGIRRRRAAAIASADRKRHRRLLLVTALMTVASGVIVHAFVTDNYAIKYVAALLRFGAAAVLQDRVVLGRARRLDHVLGVPAGDLRRRRRLREPRAAPRADSLGRRDHRRRARCSSSS